MSTMSSDTYGWMQDAGWSPDRRVDMRRAVDSLRGRGYTVSAAARAFLEQYGGLVVRPPRIDEPDGTNGFHFDPIPAAKRSHPDVMIAYGKLIDRQLCPVGQAQWGYDELAVDETGALYALRQGTLYRLGRDAVEGIDALCHGSVGVDLGEIPDD